MFVRTDNSDMLKCTSKNWHVIEWGASGLMQSIANNCPLEQVKSYVDTKTINLQDRRGATAIQYCLDSSHRVNDDVVKLILENGADVHIRNKEGKSAFVYACSIETKISHLVMKYATNIHQKCEIFDRSGLEFVIENKDSIGTKILLDKEKDQIAKMCYLQKQLEKFKCILGSIVLTST